MALADDISFARLALSIEAVELLIKPLLRGMRPHSPAQPSSGSDRHRPSSNVRRTDRMHQYPSWHSARCGPVQALPVHLQPLSRRPKPAASRAGLTELRASIPLRRFLVSLIDEQSPSAAVAGHRAAERHPSPRHVRGSSSRSGQSAATLRPANQSGSASKPAYAVREWLGFTWLSPSCLQTPGITAALATQPFSKRPLTAEGHNGFSSNLDAAFDNMVDMFE